MAAVSAMEHAGVPIDVQTHSLLCERWTDIQDKLIAEIVRDMAKIFPTVSPIRELRSSLADLRLSDLQIGRDGRNRAMLGPFGTRTGRNAPSNSKFIFGPSVWIRSLIKPPPGHGLAYLDFSAQEFGIAAALSGDENMIAAYLSGDPYLAFGKQGGILPPDAQRKDYGAEREMLKACILGLQYGMGEFTLAHRIDRSPLVARSLIQVHQETYRQFWKWIEHQVDMAMLTNVIRSVFGWTQHVNAKNCNPRSFLNFPMQANGAEMLRLACGLATEAAIEVVAPVHDALMILTPPERLEADIERTRRCMAEASRVVLGGFEIRVDAKVIRWPDRYFDPRGRVMWERVCKLIEKPRSHAAVA